MRRQLRRMLLGGRILLGAMVGTGTGAGNAQELVLEDQIVPEGDEGRVEHVLRLALDEAQSQPVSVRFEIVAGTATDGTDFDPVSGTLVFPPGSLEPGLPRPETAQDPLLRSVDLAPGFGMDVLAEVDHPAGLAVAPEGSAFGEALFVGVLDVNGVGVSDLVLRVLPDGVVEDFAVLESEADPTSLEFPPEGSRYGDALFVSGNNRDGFRPGDQGGTILRVDPDGGVVDFSAVGIPLGPGEPGELAFGLETAFGDHLFVANSVGKPGDLLVLFPDGSVAPVVDDGWFEDSGNGLAPRSLAIDRSGRYGGLAYFGEFGRACSCLKRVEVDGTVRPWVSSLPGDPYSLEFAPEGVFGGDLFVAVDDGASGSILRVQPDGTWSVFLSGLQGYLSGNGKDAIEFSWDGSMMYVADYFADRIYRVVPDTQVVLPVWGDREPEPDETVQVRFLEVTRATAPRDPFWVTIENDDDGDTPPEILATESPVFWEDQVGPEWAIGLRDDQPLDALTVQVTSLDSTLVPDASIAFRREGSELLLELSPAADQFGETQLRLEVEDAAGHVTSELLPVVVRPVNDPPTLDPLADIRVGPESLEGVVTLTGIAAGPANELDLLSISASVVGEAVALDWTVQYGGGDNGRLAIQYSGDRSEVREFELVVTVSDGAEENGMLARRFSITFEPIVEDRDRPPSIALVAPEPYSVYPTEAGVWPPVGRVPIAVAAHDDRGIDRVEYFANDRPIASETRAPYGVTWSDVPEGDYELVAVVTDSSGQTARSTPVRVAVAEEAGTVALVWNHESDEVPRLVEVLFGMGFETDLFSLATVEAEALAGYDCVIWHFSGAAVTDLGGERLADWRALHETGMPFYFIGDGLAAARDAVAVADREEWDALVGIQPELERTDSERVVFETEAAEVILHGRYGTVSGRELPLSGSAYAGLALEGTPLAHAESGAVAVAMPDLSLPERGDPRSVTQGFAVLGGSLAGSDPVDDSVRLALFRNVVCWLTRCPTCTAVDLSVPPVDELEPEIFDGQWHFRLPVQHQGECVGTGVAVAVHWPEGARLIRAMSDRGQVSATEQGLVFELGRVPSADQVMLEWVLAFPGDGVWPVSAVLTSSNAEVTEANNRVTWRPILGEIGAPRLVWERSDGRLGLRLVDSGGLTFELEASADLQSWSVAGEIGGGGPVWMDLGSRLDSRFYRVRLEER